MFFPMLHVVLTIALFAVGTANADKPNAQPSIDSDIGKGVSFVFSGKIGNEFGIFRKLAGEDKPTLLIEKTNWPVVSNDGRKLAFQKSDGKALDIWVANIDGTGQLRLTSHADHDYLPSWSTDGKWIVFTSWRKESEDEERAAHLYLMRSDGRDQRRILAPTLGGSAGATWSPDGKFVVFSKSIGGQGADLFVASIDPEKPQPLGEPRQLTNDSAYNGSADFSPSGQHIAFYSDDGNGAKLMVVKVDGSDRRVVVSNGNNWYPRWSADSKWLYFVRQIQKEGDDLDLYAVHVDVPDKIVPVLELPGRQNEIFPIPAGSRHDGASKP